MCKTSKILGRVFCLFILSFTVTSVYSKDQILFLHCNISKQGIAFSESFVVDGKVPKSTENVNGDLLVELVGNNGKVLYKTSVRSPLNTPMDEASADGKLNGGFKVIDSGIVVIRVPIINNDDEILIKNINSKLRTADQTLFSIPVSEAIIKKSSSEVRQVNSEMDLVGGDGSDNRVDFVILSEGYTQSELNSGKFMNDLKIGFDHMFARTPYKEYKDYFNTYAISVPSSSSGAGGYFQSIVSGRLIYLGGTGTSRVSQLLQKHIPSYDMVLVLINTTTYGGAGAQFATASVNAQSGELILHETGHGYALLADEYDYPGASTYESVNATAETNRDRIKWKVWIDNSTPIPTPETSSYGSVVGLFEGAMYKSSGWYRPKYQCKMQSLGQPFCEVCRETIIARAYEECSPIDGHSPEQSSVDYDVIPNKTLTLDLLQPQTDMIEVVWTLNGTELSNTSSQLDLSSLSLIQGNNVIKASVSDETDWVRINYNKPQLNDEVTWNVNYDKTNALNNYTLKKHGILFNGNSIRLNDHKSGELKLEIVNARGVTVKRLQKDLSIFNGESINLSDFKLAKGVYMVKVKINNKPLLNENYLNL